FRAWAVCTQALVGMQPTVMQVPPIRSCSISVTLAPSCAALIAAGYPPGPPPNTATSHSIELRSLLAGQDREDRTSTTQGSPPAARSTPASPPPGTPLPRMQGCGARPRLP